MSRPASTAPRARPSCLAAVAACVLAVTAAVPASAQAPGDTVRYQVRFPAAEHHEADVRVTFPSVESDTLDVVMSRASPGRYALHEFAKNVHDVQARDGAGGTLEVRRANPWTWSVTGHDGTVELRYTLFGDRADGTFTGVDLTHAHLNMPATFMWAPALEDRPVSVRFFPPRRSGWRAATQLVPVGDSLRFAAPDARYFLDSPTELSAHVVREWSVPAADYDDPVPGYGTAGGTASGDPSGGGRVAADAGGLRGRGDGSAADARGPAGGDGSGTAGARRQDEQTLRLALHHRGTAAEVDSFVARAKRIVREQAAIFGGWPDFDYGTYTFIADYLPWVDGDGMEHRNSTVLTRTRPLSDGMTDHLGTLAHEFIHAWNMERVRADAIQPFDFTGHNMSSELWFGEGFTSYLDDLSLLRADVIDREAYLDRLSGTLLSVLALPARRFGGPAHMSRHAPFVDAAAWVDPTSEANTFLSYYTYGSALALGLDLTLRTRFDTSLEAYLRAVWRAHGRTEEPYDHADLQRILARVSGDAEFARTFFARQVEDSQVPDFRALLGEAGLLLRKSQPERAFVGFARLEAAEGGVRIASATRIGFPLHRTGLDRGDVIRTLDGDVMRSPDDLRSLLAEAYPGQALTVTWEGRGRHHRGLLALAEDPRLELVPYEEADRDVTAEMRALREAWLGSER